MAVRIKPIKPSKPVFDARQLKRAIDNTLTALAKDIEVDFKVTTATWKHQPDFSITEATDARIIGTDDQVYGWIDEGTKPHVIQARAGGVLVFPGKSRPKTVPGAIRSNKGGTSGGKVFRPRVRHPGTKPRMFAKTIGDKWGKQAPAVFDRMLKTELG